MTSYLITRCRRPHFIYMDFSYSNRHLLKLLNELFEDLIVSVCLLSLSFRDGIFTQKTVFQHNQRSPSKPVTLPCMFCINTPVLTCQIKDNLIPLIALIVDPLDVNSLEELKRSIQKKI